MPKTKRVQVLMDPREFKAIERLAHTKGSSVSDFMREAARAELARGDKASRSEAARRFLALPDVPLPEWRDLKREIEERRGARIP